MRILWLNVSKQCPTPHHFEKGCAVINGYTVKCKSFVANYLRDYNDSWIHSDSTLRGNDIPSFKSPNFPHFLSLSSSGKLKQEVQILNGYPGPRLGLKVRIWQSSSLGIVDCKASGTLLLSTEYYSLSNVQSGAKARGSGRGEEEDRGQLLLITSLSRRPAAGAELGLVPADHSS